MDEAGEIVAISVPFASGVAIAAMAANIISVNQEYTVAGIASALCCLMLLYGIHVKWRTGMTAVLFAMTGLLCGISQDLMMNGSSMLRICDVLGQSLERLEERIDSIPLGHESSNALVRALMTGDRSGLSGDEIRAFRNSGASHILALSGLHLGVIYFTVNRLLSIAGNSPHIRAVRSAVIIAFSGAYTLMTGAGPSIVRAFLFILFNETGKLDAERRKSPARTLLAALTVQLAIDPAVIKSLGFQLSYLAMGGLVVLYPHMASWYPDGGRFRRIDPLKRIWNVTAMSVSCQCFTAPLVWLRFHSFPKYFIITNLLAMPLTSAIIALAFVTVCLSFLGIDSCLSAEALDWMVQTLISALDTISGLP